MGANQIQVGGDHYKKYKYEHWDFVCDTDLHYLLGCATKYMSRWRDKAGIEDLKKPIHFIQKASEKGVSARISKYIEDKTFEFIRQLENSADGLIIILIMENKFDKAIKYINKLIEIEINIQEEKQFQNEIIQARRNDGV